MRKCFILRRIILKTFKNCLNNILVVGNKYFGSNSIENSIEFITLFITNLIESTEDESTSQISNQNIFCYLFEVNHTFLNDNMLNL
jgi:hypothetical protein